jgi:NADH-quinone oxidoreductase subunit M
MYQRVMFGPLDKPENRDPQVRDLGLRERLVFGVLVLAALVMGMVPQPILERTAASVQVLTATTAIVWPRRARIPLGRHGE